MALYRRWALRLRVLFSILGLLSLSILVQLPMSALMCRVLGRVQPRLLRPKWADIHGGLA